MVRIAPSGHFCAWIVLEVRNGTELAVQHVHRLLRLGRGQQSTELLMYGLDQQRGAFDVAMYRSWE